MLHLKNNTLTRRKPLHRRRDALLNLAAEQSPLRIKRWPMLPLPLEKISDTFLVMVAIHFRSLIFRTRLAPPQMIEADVRHNAVEPGVEAAFKTEAVQIAVNLQESFLINVTRVFRTLHQVQSQAQYVTVILTHQFLESRAIASLRLHHQATLVKLGHRRHRSQGGFVAARPAQNIGQSQSWKWHIRFLFAYARCYGLQP